MVAAALRTLMLGATYPNPVTIGTNAYFNGYWTIFVTTTPAMPPGLTASLTPAGSYKTTVGYRVGVNGKTYSIGQVVNYGYDYPAYPTLANPLNFYDMTYMPPQGGFVINTIKAFTYDPAFPTYVDGSAGVAPLTYDVINVPGDPSELGPNDVYFDGNLMHYGMPFMAHNPEVVRYLYK